MVSHRYFSQREGTNPNLGGLLLADILGLFVRVFERFSMDGYFAEAFGFACVDNGHIAGNVEDVELEILLAVRKKGLWPISVNAPKYSEDDLFDVIEYLFQHVSKPIDGTMHSYAECGMHWETFSQLEGRSEFRGKVNTVLGHYEKRFELSERGEVLRRPEAGFEPIFDADIPSADHNIVGRLESAVLRYRRHGSTIDDRRQAVCDLIAVLEYLRPKAKALLTKADENDLFNIANNFGLRHHNEIQKTNYDGSLWLSWMFYFYLATIHVVLRKIEKETKA
jgi:hypothetical protein